MDTPRTVMREECLGARKEHLAHAKELTRLIDELERNRLPAVEVDKEYVFEETGPRMQRSKCMRRMSQCPISV